MLSQPYYEGVWTYIWKECWNLIKWWNLQIFGATDDLIAPQKICNTNNIEGVNSCGIINILKRSRPIPIRKQKENYKEFN
jgi:hypothetical protein